MSRQPLDCERVAAYCAPSSARHWNKRFNDDCQVNTRKSGGRYIIIIQSIGRVLLVNFFHPLSHGFVTILYYYLCTFVLGLCVSVRATIMDGIKRHIIIYQICIYIYTYIKLTTCGKILCIVRKGYATTKYRPESNSWPFDFTTKKMFSLKTAHDFYTILYKYFV